MGPAAARARSNTGCVSKTFAERASAELRREEAKACEIERRLDEAQALAPLATEQPEVVRAPLAGLWRKRRALLIINSKSGPNRESLLRARELVDLLADTESPAVCPHGSPIILHFSDRFLERQFDW